MGKSDEWEKFMKVLTFLVLTILFVSNSVCAEVVVIVHPSNSSSLDSSTISRIFTGKAKSFPGGNKAIPINQDESSSVTGEFNNKALNKSSSQLKAYWSKLVFTGKGTPPKSVGNDAEVLQLVSNNPNIIGYVSASAVNDSVKVVATF